MSKDNTKSNTKTFHEGKTKTLRRSTCLLTTPTRL